MIRSLTPILLLAAASIYYTDLGAESAFRSLLLPLIALIALALWRVNFFHRRGIRQTIDRGAGPGGAFGDDLGGGDGA